jgi:uncharacterized lipoprotein YmbA
MKPRVNTDQHGWSRLPALSFMLSALSFLGGCSLPQPQADPTRFYVLSAPGLAAAEPAAKGSSVYLRPIELASYLKAKPMIVRRGNNEIEFREYAHWGEPLELGLGRVLREDLLTRGAARAVLAAGLRPLNVDCDFELSVRVLSCEGAAEGGVNFRAVWELSTTGAPPKVTAHGEFRSDGLRWDGKSESELADQLSKAVSDLSGEIAAGLANAGK